MELSRIDPERLVFVDEDGHPHFPGSPLRLRARRRAGLLRDPEKPRQEHDASYEPSSRRDGTFHGRGRGDHRSGLRDLRREGARAEPKTGTDRGDGQPRGP